MDYKDFYCDQLERMVGGTVHLTAGTAGAVIKAYGNFLGGIMEAWAGAIDRYLGKTSSTEELLRPPRNVGSLGTCENSHWSPPVDVNEDDDEYRIIMDVPIGFEPKYDKPSDDNRMLTIHCDRKLETGRRHRAERSHGSFSRSFEIPTHVDVDNIKYDYEKGVLCFHLPKKVRTIEIQEKKA